MYRLLIVDDEVSIVLGLEKILGESDQWELDIYKAFGAREALELAAGKQVDILLADIRMPGMDGLKLGREIVKLNPGCKLIYLTGFDNFEYIYEAMERMGTQYLLKSESDERIVAAVGKAVDMLEEELRERIRDMRLKLEQKKSQSLMKKDALAKWLDSGYSKQQLGRQIEKYRLNLDLDRDLYLFAALPRAEMASGGHMERLERLYQAKGILDDRFGESFRVESMVWEEELLVWLLQPLQEDRVMNVRRFLQRTAEEFQEMARQMQGKVFDIGYTGQGRSADVLPGDFYGLVRYMKSSVQLTVPMIYQWETCRGEKEAQEQEEALRKLEDYILEHVGEDVSLDHLAGLVHFNPSYLSRFYKKNRGMTISEYIAGVRVGRAQRLLRYTEKRIADIASELGFETPSAFGAFFRKRTGQSPAQYRKSM